MWKVSYLKVLSKNLTGVSILRQWIWNFVGTSYSSLAFRIEPEISQLLALLEQAEQACIFVAMNMNAAKVKEIDFILLQFLESNDDKNSPLLV